MYDRYESLHRFALCCYFLLKVNRFFPTMLLDLYSFSDEGLALGTEAMYADLGHFRVRSIQVKMRTCSLNSLCTSITRLLSIQAEILQSLPFSLWSKWWVLCRLRLLLWFIPA